jgi:hypothetical protein
MDVKKALAKGIQDGLLNGVPLDKSEPIEEMEGEGTSIEATRISDLVTQIRIKTVNRGVRYMTVKVSESW